MRSIEDSTCLFLSKMMKEFYVSELLILMQTFFNMLLYVYSDEFS